MFRISYQKLILYWVRLYYEARVISAWLILIATRPFNSHMPHKPLPKSFGSIIMIYDAFTIDTQCYKSVASVSKIWLKSSKGILRSYFWFICLQFLWNKIRIGFHKRWNGTKYFRTYKRIFHCLLGFFCIRIFNTWLHVFILEDFFEFGTKSLQRKLDLLILVLVRFCIIVLSDPM